MSKINFIPKSKHFLIRTKEKTTGGIYIPESAAKEIANSMMQPQMVECPAADCTFVQDGDYVKVEPHQVAIINLEEGVFLLVPEYRVDGKVIGYTPKNKEEIKSPIILQ